MCVFFNCARITHFMLSIIFLCILTWIFSYGQLYISLNILNIHKDSLNFDSRVEYDKAYH